MMLKYSIMCVFLCSWHVDGRHMDDDKDIMSCLEMFKPENVEEMCCQSFDIFTEDVTDCFNVSNSTDEWKCKEAECILEHNKMIKNGEIDEDMALKYLEDLAQKKPNEKPMVDRVKQECLGQKYLMYPPNEACPAVKLQICSYANAVVVCPSWKQNKLCNQMEIEAKNCRRFLDNVTS